jgi:hypothetical protein
MRVSITTINSIVSQDELLTTVQAVARQVSEDFGPAWSVDATLRVVDLQISGTPNPEINQGDAVIYVSEFKNDPNQVANAVGYHTTNHAGLPYGLVFTDIAAQIGQPWSVTFSHEVLELLADPETNLLVVAPNPDQPRQWVLRPYEVCDPVQSDQYTIDGVAVSDFVTPAYFTNSTGGAKTDYLGTGLAAFAVRPGGYFTYLDPSTGAWQQVSGSSQAMERSQVKERIFGQARRLKRHRATGLLPKKGGR